MKIPGPASSSQTVLIHGRFPALFRRRRYVESPGASSGWRGRSSGSSGCGPLACRSGRLGGDNLVAEAFEGGEVLLPFVAHVGVAEAQVVAELLFELLEQHALVADFDEVEHFFDQAFSSGARVRNM